MTSHVGRTTPSEGPRECLLRASLPGSGGCQLSRPALACGRVTAVFILVFSVSVPKLSSSLRAAVTGLGAPLTQWDLILTGLHLQRPLFPRRSHSQVPGIRTCTFLSGLQNSTCNKHHLDLRPKGPLTSSEIRHVVCSHLFTSCLSSPFHLGVACANRANVCLAVSSRDLFGLVFP